MEISKPQFQMKTIRGEPVQSGDTIVTPVSQVVAVQAPFLDFVWNRPHGVHVRNRDEESTIQIVNVSRMAQIAIYGIGAAIMVLLWLVNRK